MKEKKFRLDLLLVQKNLVETRSLAQKLILAGQVLVAGQKITQSSVQVLETSQIEIKQLPRFVSRGGEKLYPAIKYFNIDVKDKICLDIGASTGGFTHCLLSAGAKIIYAVDVGYGQLAQSLRENKKVIIKEKVNARYLNKEIITELVDLITVDVSFISLKLIIPSATGLLKNNGEIIMLIKPQFEAEKKEVKKGVVKDNKIIEKIVNNITLFCKEQNLKPVNTFASTLKGPKGNQEVFLYCVKTS